jgi:DNA polymerase III epsilon subunit-like protein
MSNIIYVDVETNGYKGLDILSKYNRIIQFGALSNDFEFEMFVNPGIPISPSSTKFHGINDFMVRDAQRFDKVWEIFLSKLDKNQTHYFLVAHGGTFFDKIMIIKELHRFGVDFDSSRFTFIDTDPILRHHLPNAQSHNLGSLVRQYIPSYNFQGEHTALADCKALKVLIEGMNVPLEPKVRDDFKLIYELGNYKWLLKEYSGVENTTELANTLPSFVVYRWIKCNVHGITEDQAVMAILRIYNFDPNIIKQHIF